jgi:ribosomal protein L14E/L6E/L27E
MPYKVGDVVISTAGKDKGTAYRITGLSDDGRWYYLRDGKIHGMSAPKKKNRKHVSATLRQLEMENIHSDRRLKKALKSSDY